MVKLVYEDGQDFFLKKGDYVDLDFYVSGLVSAAQVVSLKTINKDKVLVDVDVVIDYGPISKTKVRIHGIDSHCCRLRDEAYMKESNEKYNRKPTPSEGENTVLRTIFGPDKYHIKRGPIVLSVAFGPDEYPPLDQDSPNDNQVSIHVLIDINGKKEYFDTGWYNFEEKKWYNCNRDFDTEIDKGQFKWRYID